jgi:hypothetical protein
LSILPAGALTLFLVLPPQLAFSEHLNTTLAHDAFLTEHGYLPITSVPKLFTALIDGVLLW